MRRTKRLLLFVSLFSILSIKGQIFSSQKKNKGMWTQVNQDSTLQIQLNGLLQSRFFTTFYVANENSEDVKSNFFFRTTRLDTRGWIFSPKLKYRVHLGFAERDIEPSNAFSKNVAGFIIDASVSWQINIHTEVTAGQFMLPANIERAMPIFRLQFVDRSLADATFNLNRDIGFMFSHQFALGNTFFIQEYAITQGEGRNNSSGNIGGYLYSVKWTFFPFGKFYGNGLQIEGDYYGEKKPKLALGIAYNFNDNAVRNRGTSGDFLFIDEGNELFETDIHSVYTNALFKYKGFSVNAGYFLKEAKTPQLFSNENVPITDRVLTGEGFNIQTGYMLNESTEVALRYSKADFYLGSGNQQRNQWSFGGTKFLFGQKVKLLCDLSWSDFKPQNNHFELHLGLDFIL